MLQAILLLNRWLSAVARRMFDVFLHPDFIYKLTKAYQIECDWYARTDVMPNNVCEIFCCGLKTFIFNQNKVK